MSEGEGSDDFDVFEVKCRVIDPQNGNGDFVFEADGPQKIWENKRPWIQVFSLKVEVRVMITEEEFVERAKTQLGSLHNLTN